MSFISLSTLEFDQIEFNIKNYVIKKNEKMEIKEYVETLLRDRIYQNPNQDVHEGVQEMVYVKRNVLEYDRMIHNLMVKDYPVIVQVLLTVENASILSLLQKNNSCQFSA